MDKTQDPFLYRFLRNTPEYEPHVPGSLFFDKLNMRVIDIENWDAALEIERSAFEELVSNDWNLQMTYIDIFSKDGRYFVLLFEINGLAYNVYCMVDNMEIILIFFNTSPNEIN
jgi:hypothetical protein